MNNIIVIYKEVGKAPIFREISNNIKCFETILGGEIDFIPYEEIEIVCLKNRANLKPNIYLRGLSGIDAFSIKGNLLVIKKENEEFKSLNKSEAVRYGTILTTENFDYSRIDENGKYITNKELKRRKKALEEKQKKNDTTDNLTKNKKQAENPLIDTEDILAKKALELIVKIQVAMLEFMNFYKENK